MNNLQPILVTKPTRVTTTSQTLIDHFIINCLSQTLPTVAIKEVCTRWFYNQGTVSFGFSIFYFNIMRNCVKVTIFGSQAFFLSNLCFSLNHIVKVNLSYF